MEGCLNPNKLLDVLRNEKKQSEVLQLVSREQVAGVNGSEAMLQLKLTQITAVTWIHLHEYSNSFCILDQLFEKLATITEGIALHICFLLLDVAGLSHHASRFSDVINYVETVFCISTLICQDDNGSSTEQQSSNLVTKSPVFSSAPFRDVSSSDPTINFPGSPLSRSLSEEAEYANFFSTLDISGQNLTKKPVQFSNNFTRTQNDDSFPVIDLRLKLHLYKVSFLLLTRNLKADKHEVKMAMNIAGGKNYSMALFLRSQLEYARGNHHKSVKLLMASSRTEPGDFYHVLQ